MSKDQVQVEVSPQSSGKSNKAPLNMLNLIPAPVAYIDKNHCYRYVNAAFENLIGADAGSFIGKSMAETAGKNIFLDAKPYLDLVLSGLAAGFETTMNNKEGLRRLEISLTPDFNDHKEVLGYAALVSDITDKKNSKTAWTGSEEKGIKTGITGAINMPVDITEERVAAKAILEKDERFRMIAHLVPIVIWMSDQDGNFVYLNKEWAELTGKAAVEGYGGSWLALLHPEDRPHTEREFMHANAEGRIYADKFRYLNKDGIYIILQANGIPRFNEAGKFIGYIGVLQNIDEQEMATSYLEIQVKERTADLTRQTEALKKSEERYHRMVREVQDYAIILLDNDGNIENWNKGAQKIKGYEAQEVIGKKSRIFYTKEDQENRLPEKLLEEAAKNGRAAHEGWCVRKDGSHFWGSAVITALHDDQDQLIGFSKVTRDLSERKITEDQLKAFAEDLKNKNEYLRQSEQRFQRMVAEVQDYAILSLNEDGDIINWNTGAQLIKGYTADEIIGKNFRLFYSKEDLESKLPESLLAMAREEGKAIHEGWRIRKDGTKFWGSVVITALHNDQGDVIGFSKVTRDLTERKAAEEALKEKNKELERRNEELSEFAYISSHDLQEPLRKIQTFTTRILESGDNKFSEKGRDFFNRIQSAAMRMRKLIEDLLAYSRTNTAELKFVTTDLNKVLRDVSNELSEIIEEKKFTMEHTLLPKLETIPFQFHQLIVNIFTNAMKFSKKDIPPHMVIRADMVKGDCIPNVRAEAQKSYHHISFKDNGIGFDPEYNAKVFEVFQRLHGRSEYEGTGIGLAICKKIADNHGGFITAEGCINEGATFHVYLPA